MGKVLQNAKPKAQLMKLATKSSNRSLADHKPCPQVIEYLLKKGYNRTEQMLRLESSNLDRDGKPIQERVEDLGNIKYSKGFRLLSTWIDQNLDIYKVSKLWLDATE